MAGDTSRAITLRLDLACFFRFLFFSLALFVRNRSLSAGESSRFFAAEGKRAATRRGGGQREGGAERGRGEEETWLAAVERRKKLFQFFLWRERERNGRRKEKEDPTNRPALRRHACAWTEALLLLLS